ncbi:rhomboid family intramembrane serine protease [candidate division KSB1 bacterium]|nr:rhomboid family intramembrane serine protease [candidate division KSB1 bacterium]
MIKRKTSGSMVCPNCGRLISANAKECMHCGRKNPGLWGFGPELNKILGSAPGVIPALTITCVIIYIISIFVDPGALLQSRGLFSFLSPSGAALDRLGMTGQIAIFQGKWWTLVTAIYLHGGILHIFFNMLWLRQLGQMVQDLFGSSRTFLIFTIAGVVGFIASFMLGIAYTIGASGSIFGLLGALIYYGRKRGGYFGTALYRQVGSWALILFIFGFLMPGVNNFAHAGGFLGGYLSAMVFGFNEMNRENATHRFLAMIALGITIACFGLVLFA